MKNFQSLWILFLFCISSLGATSSESYKKPLRILVGAPVCQKPAILHEFLESFKRLERTNFTIDYYFVDDNKIDEAKTLLQMFQPPEGEKVHIIPSRDAQHYECNEVTHCWNEGLVWKVARFKDEIINYARENSYDYLFLIDSDIVLHPKTIDQLIKANKDIISNIFWTSWEQNGPQLPQVWLMDTYSFVSLEMGQELALEEKVRRENAFLAQLRIPGIYEVGGLGACTLISRNALQKGVSFRRIQNVTLWGEDRHFCIRAVAMGLLLHVDTHYPAYHIYRESYLAGVPDFIESCRAAVPPQ